VSKRPTFEKDMARLEELVRKLESGELSLEESLVAFEEGMKLAEGLGKVLDKAQERVQKLTRGEQGEFVLDDFEDDQGKEA
jgi:exodeoxyribonuclease VII small subunit